MGGPLLTLISKQPLFIIDHTLTHVSNTSKGLHKVLEKVLLETIIFRKHTGHQ